MKEITLGIDRPTVRAKIVAFENVMRKQPNAMIGDCFPLEHSFADGMYIRKIYAPKGALIVTKLFKQTHPTFLMKGECSILTEDGVIRVKAPLNTITLAGTKRIIYIHEDVEWVTVHRTNKTNLKKIEKEIIAKTYDELGIDTNNKIQEFLDKVTGGE